MYLSNFNLRCGILMVYLLQLKKKLPVVLKSNEKVNIINTFFNEFERMFTHHEILFSPEEPVRAD